jgi:hypothetical protein
MPVAVRDSERAFWPVEAQDMRNREDMLWLILAFLVALWFVGSIAGCGGDLIHIILVVAAVVTAMAILSDRRAAP